MEWFFRAIGQASLSPKKADCGDWEFMLRSLNKKVSWAPHQKQRKNTKHLLASKHVWRWRRKKMAKHHRKIDMNLHDDFLSPFGPPGCRTCLGIDSSCTFHKHETVENKWKKKKNLDLLPVKLRHKSSSLFNVFVSRCEGEEDRLLGWLRIYQYFFAEYSIRDSKNHQSSSHETLMIKFKCSMILSN